ncbi:MAG: PQQ-binding-like beta-propeller repeat protein, partial [Lentisphaeria bacterium]|nr:PQQ-binding-like beta-propeller repeat protein [Lentisphaeria bacterium]
SGKLLWKRHLGELGSADLTLTKDAQRLFAKLATRTYCFDKTGKMLFQLESPGNGIAATGFKLGDHLLYIDSAQQRIYQAGQLELRCLDFNGKVLWRYDDIPNCTEKMDFYLRRGSLVKAVSKDYVLVNFFGIKKSIFDTFVDYWKPELMLLSATDGKVIWRKKNMPLNFGQALIIAKKVVVYTESGDLQIYDPKGKLLKILRPGPGIDTMKAVPGKFAIIASALVTKDVGKIPLNHSKLLYMIDLENGNLQNISEKHEIADFAVGAGILLSDWSGQIVMTDFSAKKLWSTVNPGSAKLAFLKDGVLCATSLGKLYLRDIANGKIRKTIDLNAYNYPGNSGKDIQRIKGEAALMQTDAGKLQSAITPGNGIVDISKTLLKDGTWPGVPVFKDPSAGNCLKIIDKAIETEINCEPNNSYLIQLHLRMEKSRKPLLPYRFNIRSTSLERLVVEVRAGKKLIYQVSLAGSDSWVERQLAFKSGEYKKLTLRIYQEWYVDFPRGQEESKKVSLSKRKVTAAMLIAGLQCRKLKYGTDNLLANKAKLGVKMIIPNPMQHLIHKVNHKPRLPWMTFFDGKISDQQTSWLRSNSAGITDLPLADVGQGGWNHATLEVSLGTTRKLSAIAVYEDPLMPRKIDKSWCGRLLRTQKTLDYAVLVHDVDLGKWVPVGAVQKNENYFNLFTFKSRNVDKIAWFWTKGDDWHIRLSEIEAYGNEDDIPEFDDLEADDDDDEIEF